MYATKIDSPKDGKKIDLASIKTNEDKGLTREEAEEKLLKLAPKLAELQELLYAAGTHSVLIVLQGRDTAGKDGTLKAIAGAMNPVGTRVVSFKVPTATDLSHDFLWRVHQQTPARGETVFFNRSHYEDVLVVRVHNLAPKNIWEKRYDQINHFEALLTDTNTIILKFYLHISKSEQKERLLIREQEPEKAWKLNAGDWKEREFWEDYTQAYEDILTQCATKNAPWFIVPADKKWFRNVAVAEAIIEALDPYKTEWEENLKKRGDVARAALAALEKKE
jgi:PPK2 family polyphosphate:nucleotide phosphotransferase